MKSLLFALNVLVFILLISFISFSKIDIEQPIPDADFREEPIPMPVVPIPEIDDNPIEQQSTPVAHRSSEYRRLLATSVRINTTSGSGSGTIVHFDYDNNVAYVLSCGHLWSDNRSREQLEQSPRYVNVTTWHTNRRLIVPKVFRGRVLFHIISPDMSLIKFTPDYIPQVAPIAPRDIELDLNLNYHSMGSDRGSETARYGVRILSISQSRLVTQFNTPRPGRSGGGLLTTDGLLIGICVARDNYGRGYFTPLDSIHTQLERQGFDYLLNQVPEVYIQDHTNPGTEYDSRFFPRPREIIPFR